MGHSEAYKLLVFQNLNCNPVHVIKMPKKVDHDSDLYYKGTNLIDPTNFTGPNTTNAGKAFKFKYRDPPLVGCLKWNTDASKILITSATTISYVCMDNTGYVQLAC